MKSRMLLIVSLAIAMTACTAEKQITEVDHPNKVTIQESMNSDQLADAAEQLMGPFTFMLADNVLDKALERNPENKKAQLYKTLLRPLMATKGLWKRARPFAKQNGNLGKWEQIMSNFPESPLKKFYSEGDEDIQTTEDVMKVVDDIRDGFNSLRLWIKSNQDLELVINLNPHLFEKFIQDKMFQSCQVVESHNGEDTTYEFKCDYTNIAMVRANSADLAVIQQMAAGEYLWLSLATGYRLDGVEELAQIDPMGRMSNQGRQNFLESKKNFGLKRASNSMSAIRGLGSDFAAAAQWALKYQETLCPQAQSNPWGYPTKIRRKGYLFELGICADSSPAHLRALALLESLIQGPQEIDVKGHPGQKIKADPFKFFDNPIADIKSIFPASYNPCGKIDQLRDSSVGGLFPNADTEQYLPACH